MNENKSERVKDLIKKFRIGDKTALEELMLLTYKDLFLLSYSYLKDRMLAEDVVSETFVKLIEKVHTIKTEENLNGYLHTIVINKSLDIIRKRKKEVYVELNDSTELSENFNDDKTNARLILSMMDRSEREVLLLWNYNYTLNEISDKTNFTVNQVRLLLKKAKKNFSIEYHKNDAD